MPGNPRIWKDGWRGCKMHALISNKGNFRSGSLGSSTTSTRTVRESTNVAGRIPTNSRSSSTRGSRKAKNNFVAALDDRSAEVLLARPQAEPPQDRVPMLPGRTAPVPVSRVNIRPTPQDHRQRDGCRPAPTGDLRPRVAVRRAPCSSRSGQLRYVVWLPGYQSQTGISPTADAVSTRWV